MNQLKLAFVPVSDEIARGWLDRVPEFDSGILAYPTTRLLCAYNSHPVGFLPVHKAAILETLALNPEASNEDKAQAMRDLVKAATLTASSDGIKEIYFLGTDKHVIDIATKPGVGFEELPWKIYRMKL